MSFDDDRVQWRLGTSVIRSRVISGAFQFEFSLLDLCYQAGAVEKKDESRERHDDSHSQDGCNQ